MIWEKTHTKILYAATSVRYVRLEWDAFFVSWVQPGPTAKDVPSIYRTPKGSIQFAHHEKQKFEDRMLEKIHDFCITNMYQTFKELGLLKEGEIHYF